MTAQYIEIEGKEAVILSAADYRALLDKAEMLDDVVFFDRAKAALMAGDDELVPAEIAHAILDGENPIRVWRKHRGLSQVQLAERIGKSQGYLAQIESGKREGTLSIYRKLADVLAVDLDDLVG